jgi:hypothetical protein
MLLFSSFSVWTGVGFSWFRDGIARQSELVVQWFHIASLRCADKDRRSNYIHADYTDILFKTPR